MKRERIFYLDFIRMIAAIAIVITHYNAIYIFMEPQMIEKSVITSFIGNIYIGNWGVSLFFIISGAALMYVYQEKLEIKTFFKKRFLSIYPMFWIAYIGAATFSLLKNQVLPGHGVPKYRIIYTILGFDGLLASRISTFYILGEWFLGVIILIYILFPLLRKMMNSHPVVLAAISLIVYIGFALFYHFQFPLSTVVFVRIPEVIFGMYMIKYKVQVKWYAALVSLGIVIINTILKPQFIETIQTTYIGIASFIILVYVSKYFGKFKLIRWFSSLISKYSYAIFLVHHVIIAYITSKFDMAAISIKKSYLLFFAICVVIGIASYMLYAFEKLVMKTLNQIYKR